MTEKEIKLFNPYRQFLGSFIPNCLLEYKGLSSTAKLLWAKLAQYAGEDGKCYPKQETLAKDMGIDKRNLIRRLKELEKAGFIYIERPVGKDKLLNKNNLYYFIKHFIFDVDAQVTSVSPREVTSVSPREVTSVSPPIIGIIESYKKESYKNSSESKKMSISTLFETFWKLYPRRIGKGLARKSFEKALLKKKVSFEELMKALEAQVNHSFSQDMKFIPLPATWLNQERWSDDITTTSKNTRQIFLDNEKKKKEELYIAKIKKLTGLNNPKQALDQYRQYRSWIKMRTEKLSLPSKDQAKEKGLLKYELFLLKVNKPIEPSDLAETDV